MDYETVIGITVVAIGGFLSIWGASLVVRALASRASRVAMRIARRIPKSINTAPPQLSRLQFWFGMIVGPIVCLAGTSLSAFVISMVLLQGEPFRWSTVPPLMLVVFAGAALVVGLRWDKAKGRRRCPTCWYDYAGLADSAACPECGHVPAGARTLARTRRSRPILLAAPVLLIVAWMAHVTPKAMRTSWRAFVPTTLLVGFYEHIPDTLFATTSRMDDASLTERLENEEMWYWQERWLGRRAARLLTTSTDPRTCARSSYFAYWAFDEADLPDPDATAANLLRVGLAASRDQDPIVRTYGVNVLSQIPFAPGPLSRAAFAADTSIVLDRFATPTGRWDHRTFGRLIASFASPTDDVVACVRQVALDRQWGEDRRDAAASLLGLLATRDEALLEGLKAEYQTSQGDVRSMLALAIVSARVQRGPVAQSDAVIQPVNDEALRNSAALAQSMRDPDLEIRRAAAKVPMVAGALTDPVVDWEQTRLDLAELAKADPASAAIAIRSMHWNGVTDDVVPVIARILESGSAEEVVMISRVLRWARMDSDWLQIHAALSARVNDSALDQATIGILKEAKAKLDVVASQEAIDVEMGEP